MLKPALSLILVSSSLALSGCATPTGPVEVTRFVEPATTDRLGHGAIFVESAPGSEDNLELSPFKAAVAGELARLGYTESDRATAGQVAQVRVERYMLSSGGKRSPVSVGVGGSTGTYGSGVGLGVGINLGGGDADRVGTQLGVIIRDAATGRSLWEGRAEFTPPENSPLARTEANAQTVAAALFSDFPGNNGETIEVEVPK